MVVQAPPEPPNTDCGVDAGLIEDARARQRRERLLGLALALAVAIASALFLGFAGSGGGINGGGRSFGKGRGASGGDPGGSSLTHQGRSALLGAPRSQPAAADGPSSQQCPLAERNRYLPARSGCVTAIRADVTGGGGTDLVITYSLLNHTRAYRGGGSGFRNYFGATRAFLEVVTPSGRRYMVRISATAAVTIIAAKRVNRQRGAELFLETFHTSSGFSAAAYGLDKGRLADAGPALAYGGDSGLQAGFNCVTGAHPKLIQRTFAFIGPTGRAWWKETAVTYKWDGPRLVRSAERSFNRYGELAGNQIEVGSGCGPVDTVRVSA